MRRVLIVALAVLIFAAPDAVRAAETVTILHTSDLHGRVHPVDSLADADLHEGLARVVTAVKAVRAEGRPVLLLDSGDTIQGAPEQAIALSGGPEAADPIVGAMNLAGYDAMAVGNHEFDFGLPRLETSRRQAKFPFLSANTLGRGDREAFPPYQVREVAGVRIGILGLVTTGVPGWVSPGLLGGLRFVSPLGAARTRVAELRGKARCDFVIVLTHQGFERDPKTGDERRGSSGENQAYALANLPGVDLVLAGHGHVVVAPQRIGQTWVSAPGRWGEVLTRFDVTFEKTGPEAAWRVSDVRGRNLPMKKVEPDPEVVAAATASHEAAMKVLAARLTVLETPVSTRRARSEDTGILDWLHGVQRAESGADLSFASVLALEPLDWPAGPLTIRQVWQFYPYENSLVTVRATGKTVRDALERAAGCFGDSGAPLRGCDTLEGADYGIDPTRPPGKRVVYLRRNGKDVADGDVFTVALNSYRALGGGGFGMWKRAEWIREKGNVRNMLIADTRGKKSLRLVPTGNWKVVARP